MTLWEAVMDLISFMGKYLIGCVVGSIVCFFILRPIKVYHEGFDDGWEAALAEEDNRPNTVKFPTDAACMVHKREILQSWAKKDGGQDDV